MTSTDDRISNVIKKNRHLFAEIFLTTMSFAVKIQITNAHDEDEKKNKKCFEFRAK